MRKEIRASARTSDIETKECIVCFTLFPRRTSKTTTILPKNVRRIGSLTCSPGCSKKWIDSKDRRRQNKNNTSGSP